MHFSRHQEQAERAARRLLWLYGVATLTVVLAANVLAAVLWNLVTDGALDYPTGFFATNTLVVAGFIVGGSWLESARLREDGAVIADRLGAVPLDASGDDPLHRRLRNVVEELAIAARIGVPRAYVLADEPSINALTAGFDPNESVVIVTQGALQRLTRDELQGVVAHEVSHIVNGDVGLNTRLVGLNYGLELVALFGRSMLSQVRLHRHHRQAGVLVGLIPLLLVGAGVTLTVVGSIGVVAARAIRAGIGRQREFFADAQAVAFTRNRDGIGGALRKVAALSAVPNAAEARATDAGARAVGWHRPAARSDAALRHPYWANVCHLLLIGPSQGSRWTATHPSLRERLQRLYGRHVEPLDPAVVDGADAPGAEEPELPALAFALSVRPLRGELDMAAAWVEPTRPADDAPMLAGDDDWLPTLPVDGAEPADDPAQEAAARLVQATRDVGDAAALLMALLATPHASLPEWPASWRLSAARAGELQAALAALPSAGRRSLRWPLLELAAARLRPIAEPRRLELVAMARAMVMADGRLTLREWMSYTLIRLRLAPRQGGQGEGAIGADAPSVRLLFTLLAQRSQVSETRAERAANAAIRDLGLAPIGATSGDLSALALDRAVERVARLPPLSRPLLVRHLVAMLPGDADVEVRDFVRLLCVAIDCPPPRLPPLARSVGEGDERRVTLGVPA